MNNRPARALALLAVLLTASTASAQTAPPTQNVELSPIACYWRTSTDAVQIGQLFTLVLTCGVLDTAATSVLPDQSRLDPGVLQLQPFDVRGGSQAPDLRTASRRYFQYEYQLRYVGEEVGKDLRLPALTLTYRVQSRVQQDGSAIEGRERQYILPAHTIRILSTVPALARDIRNPAPVTLAEIDARRFRANVLRILSWALYAVSGLIAIWGLLRFSRSRRAVTTTVVRHATDGAILGGVLKELASVRRVRDADGWSDALAARATAALRIAASYDAGVAVVQSPARSATPLTSGQLRVAGGWLRNMGVVVSGAATSTALGRRSEAGTALSSGQRARIGELQDALGRFSEAAYGRTAEMASDRLDDALASAERAVSAIRREHSWLALQLRALKQSAGDSMRARGWARS